MRVFLPQEKRPGEHRVACLPDVAAKIIKLGYEVVVESGAGVSAFASDDDYTEAGATIVAAEGVPQAIR